MGYHLAQLLSEHGCFRGYLHRMKRVADDNCVYCGEIDTPEHTFFRCPSWVVVRKEAEDKLGQALDADSVGTVLLRSEKDWETVEILARELLFSKEREERDRQAHDRREAER